MQCSSFSLNKAGNMRSAAFKTIPETQDMTWHANKYVEIHPRIESDNEDKVEVNYQDGLHWEIPL